MTAALALLLAAAALLLWAEAHLGGGRWGGPWTIPPPWRHGRHRRGQA